MPCVHLTDLEPIEPSTIEGCEDGLKIGGQWVHLRLCMQCGHVGCCDDSPNKHAMRHFHDVGHGVVQSFEPGEHGAFCHLDNDMIDPVPEYVNRSYR
jgi:uncharacterized UBP type Zn finger protein